MTTLSLNYNYWEFWAPYDPASDFYGQQKVTFDGLNKLIYVNPEVTEISVKQDIYSNWKEWAQVRTNSSFLPAIRVVGGDPITGTSDFTGDTYFLINGWRIIIDHGFTISGVIFSDDFATPYVEAEGAKLVLNKVAALVQTVAPQINVEDLTVTVDPQAPTVVEIRQEMDANSTKLASINTTVSEIDTTLSGLQTGLTETQATMLLEMYELLGLDPTKPLVVTESARTAGTISQTIATTPTSTTVSRD